jgi:plastocyanin
MKKHIIYFLSFLTISVYSFSQTINFSGSISSNTTWNADTVNITGNVNVVYPATLTIKPGTYVEFQGHFYIGGNGTIKAIGTQTDSIYFTINDTTGYHDIESVNGGWHGLRIYNNFYDTSNISYCKLEYAKGTDGIASYTTGDMGGAIYCSHANLIISHCLIEHNNSVGTGAICFENNSSINTNLVTDNIIRYNKSLNYGAGVYSYFSYPQIINNKIIENYAVEMGGGILCSGSTPIITNNVICNNKSDFSGGGIAITYGSTAKIIGNLICNNSAPAYGGLMISSSSSNITNNTICNNTAISSNGGGMGIMESTVNVYNSIFWGNTATNGQQIAIWPGGQTNIDYCDIQGALSNIYISQGQLNGNYNNNFNVNPTFTKPTVSAGINFKGYDADWSLVQNSPCINSGSTDTLGLMLPTKDIYGKERIEGLNVDLGAAEYHIKSSIKLPETQLQLHIYPNPATDYININYSNLRNEELQLVINDNNGREIYTEYINGTDLLANKHIDVSSFNNGVYYITIRDKNKTSATKLFLKR